MSPIADPRFSSARIQDGLKRDRELAERRLKWDYIIPVLLLIGGTIAGTSTLLYLVRDTPDAPGGVSLCIGYLIGVAITTVLGCIALLITCALMATDAGPLKLGVLRLTGLFAVVMAFNIGLSFAGCFALLPTILIMVGLFVWLFEFDGVEGWVAALVTVVCYVGVRVGLVYLGI